jgi:transposase
MDPKYRTVPDELWHAVAPLLPPERPKPRGGRPRIPDRQVLAGIVYRLRTGCQWKALPSEFGSGSTCHLRMQQWARAGVFTDAFVALLKRYDRRRGIQWHWAALDALIIKAPKGGTSRGRTRRTERSAVRSATC